MNKRIVSGLLSLTMLMLLSTPALAAPADETTTEVPQAEITETPEMRSTEEAIPEPLRIEILEKPILELPTSDPVPELRQDQTEIELMEGEMSHKPYPSASYALKYKENVNGTLTITGYTGTASGDLVIPDVISGKTVTTIGNESFYQCNGFTGSLTIPDSVTTIGWNAFSGCTGFTGGLTISDSVTTITSSSFYQCSGFTGSLTIPDSVTTIEWNAFSGCSGFTGSLIIPDSVTTIGGSAFSGCTGLTDGLTIGNRVTTIGNYAFENCRGFTGALVIPDGITEIGDGAFLNCVGITNVTIPYSVTTLGPFSFFGHGDNFHISVPHNLSSQVRYCPSVELRWNPAAAQIPLAPFSEPDSGNSGIKSVSLTGEFTDLPERVFENCVALTSVTLPDSIATIGSRAFAGCDSLKFLRIPDSVSVLGKDVFAEVFHGKFISLSVPHQMKYETQYESRVLYDLDIRFNPARKDMPMGSFSGQYTIHSISVGEGITSIPAECFSRCTSMESVHLPSTLESIGDNAFQDCYALKAIDFPEGLLTIGDSSFEYCQLFDSLTFPNSLQSVGFNAFGKCKALTDISAPHHLELDRSFFDSPNGAVDLTIRFDPSASDQPLASWAVNWHTRSVTITDGLREIPSNTFSGCEYLTKVLLPDSITSIGTSAFSGCKRLSSISLPESLSRIGDSAFLDCSQLKDIYYSGSEAHRGSMQLEQNGNSSLEHALWHYNSFVSGGNTLVPPSGDRLIAPISTLSLTVLENKQGASTNITNYVLSKGALIQCNGTDYYTGNSGTVTFPMPANSTEIVISKKGYLPLQLNVQKLIENPSVYLERANDSRPVIQGVWAWNCDVLHQPFGISVEEKKTISFSADVSWCSETPGSLYLQQENRRVYFTGNTLGVILQKRFNVLEPIYIVAMDQNGTVCTKKLKLRPEDHTGLSTELENLKISVGKNMSFTLPDNVQPSFLAGQEISIGVPFLPFTATVDENGKIYMAIGLDLIQTSYTDNVHTGNYTKNKYHILNHETKTFVSKIKDIMGKSENAPQTDTQLDKLKKLKHLKDEYRKALRYPKGSFGFDADFTVMGYGEGYLDENNNIVWIDGGIILNPSVSVDKTIPFATVVPTYLELSFNADVNAQFALIFKQSIKELVSQGTIHGTIDGSVGLGLGFNKLLYASGGGTLELKPTWKIFLNKKDYFKLTTSASVYFKVGAAFLEYTYRTPPLFDVTLIEYPDPAHVPSLMDIPMAQSEYHNPDAYTVKDLSYLDDPSQFYSQPVQLMTSSKPSASLLKNNIYRESTPQLVSFPDGTALAVWPDSTDSRINSIQLFWAYHDGTAWTDPQPVQQDGTLDQSPALRICGQKAYLAWQNATRTFSETDTLDSIAPHMDISVAVFDPTTGFTCQSISNEGLDMMPVICGNDQSVYAAWVSNYENDWFGSGVNTIYYASFRNGHWSEPQYGDEHSSPILSLAADFDQQLNFAYILDEDGNLNTIDDTRIYENMSRLTSGDCSELAPYYNEHKLYWSSNGQIVSKDTPKGSGVEGVTHFEIISINGTPAAIFTQPNGLYSTLMLSYWNQSSGQWCAPQSLTDGTGFVGAYAVTKDTADQLIILYNQMEVTGTLETANTQDPYGAAGLVFFHQTPYCDLTIGNLRYSETQYSAGEKMVFHFDLTNHGSAPVHNVKVEISENNIVLQTIFFSEELLPGQTLPAAAWYTVPQNTVRQSLVLKVTCDGEIDQNPLDNEDKITLSFEDLSVERLTWGTHDDGRTSISVNIVNRGYSTRSQITAELHAGSLNGPVKQTQVVSSLDPLTLESLTFDLDEASDEILYYVLIADSGDSFTGNDSDFIAIVPEENSVISLDPVEGNRVSFSLDNDQPGICVAAVYNSVGRLLEHHVISDLPSYAGKQSVYFEQPDNLTGCKLKIIFTDTSHIPLYPALCKQL